MKVYVISNAEKLKEVVQMMKTQRGMDSVAAFARVWSATSRKEPEKTGKVSARIEIGRSAQVFKVIGTDVTLLGKMNLSMARAFVLNEVEAPKEGMKK